MAKTKVFDDNLEKYEKWFIEHQFIFKSELSALKKVVPKNKRGIEIGIGSGIFAEPLGITEGVDPSFIMRKKAEERNLTVLDAVAEELPYADNSIDFALMVTSICFVDDLKKSFRAAYRVIRNEGHLIIGFVDKNSATGQHYLKHKDESLFYKEATFFGTEEVYDLLKKTGFKIKETYQTIFGKLKEINKIQEVLYGYGKGSFIVIKAKKNENLS